MPSTFLKFHMALFIITFISCGNCYASFGQEEDYSFSSDSDTRAYQDEYPSQPYEDTYAPPPSPRYFNDNYHYTTREAPRPRVREMEERNDYFAAMPAQIASKGEKVIIIDPKSHTWGAYSTQGRLLRSGLATSGANWCSDIDRPCKTTAGVFRIRTLGDEDCASRTFPIGEGGAPMPYCMYFNGGQALHGSNEVSPANLSHGCVRLRVSDAYWLRYHFATIGTKVIIQSY